MDEKARLLICCASEEKDNPLEGMKYLESHDELYWSIRNHIKSDRKIPAKGLIHINGDNIRYECVIKNIRGYLQSDHSESAKKPAEWIERQKAERKNYKKTIILTGIKLFDCDWRDLQREDGSPIKNPRGFQTVIIK
jgi:hypothetical protein